MKLTAIAVPVITAAVTLGGCGACAANGDTVSAPMTIRNLNVAYVGETTARAKYAAYARVADKEGYRAVAQLFRAASAAEERHARNHREALARLGDHTARPGVYRQIPATTRENLRDAITGESYERDAMYPKMIREARQEGATDAERSMYYALSAERQHAALYARALARLDTRPAASGLYVCPVCGATYTKRSVPAASPVCGTPKSRFMRIK